MFDENKIYPRAYVSLTLKYEPVHPYNQEIQFCGEYSENILSTSHHDFCDNMAERAR